METLRQHWSVDAWLLAAVLVLLVLGSVEVLSASEWVAAHGGRAPDVFLAHHLEMLAVALLGFAVARRVPLALAERWAPHVLGIALVLMAGTIVFGKTVGGASRWIDLGGFRFQPGEIVKVAFAVWLAQYCARHRDAIPRDLSTLVVPLGAGAAAGLLSFLQPDMGVAMVLAAIVLAVLVAAGARWGAISTLVVGAAGLAVVGIGISPVRIQRIEAWLHPMQHRLDRAFALVNSLAAMARGGLVGRGAGASIHRLGFIPEAHTDYVFAIAGEELGLAGTLLVVACFGILLWRGLAIAIRAERPFVRYLATALTVGLVAQAGINMAVVTGLMPAKGLTLPFVSYGGTSLVMSFVAFGALAQCGALARPEVPPRVTAGTPTASDPSRLERARRADYAEGAA